MLMVSAFVHSATWAWYSRSATARPTTPIVGRAEHDELVGMKTGAYVVLLRKRAAAPKPHHDVIRLRKLFDAVARLRVRLDRENLALNAKSADAVRRTELQRSQQGVGVVPAEFRQPGQLVASGQPRERSCRSSAKLDRRLAKLAAQAEADSSRMGSAKYFMARKACRHG